ncbi:radical SAM protein [Nonomuraea sp. NPDC049784]|uniref:radical SAM protein n=1 Tax=Nonomuraea sp. NPDC049784 TaxID=3154361 RepID=UPI0033F35187
MRRLTYAEIDEARHSRGKTALLFLTDRCPVGCAHCSVDSRPDSPRIRDFRLFEQVVEGLCASSYGLIGISGGEPFIERRGLSYATERLRDAGKDVSIVTSGVWATSADPPEWIKKVIRRCGCLILSTDVFHAAALPDQRFIQAARAIAGQDVWIVTQVVDDEKAGALATGLLERALGKEWADHAEILRVPLLPYGRAADLFQPIATTPGRRFGACHLVRSPVIRYDGSTSACCNEAVILGRGPSALRRQCDDADELITAFAEFDRHALLRAVGDVGPGVLTLDPRLHDLADRRFKSICDLCWEMVDRLGDRADDPLIHSVANLRTGALG